MAAFAVVLLAPLLLTSCLKDQDDSFSVPASERLQQTLDEMKRTLRSAPYGWELEYYSSSAYGGIVYTIRFDSLTATVGCSLVPDSTDQCLYRLTNDSGPVLTFDTFSPLLHYFATPSSSEYEAKGGEFEFVVSQITDSLITVFGKKSRRNMYLRRLESSADDYARRAVAIYDNMPAGVQGQIGSATVSGRISLQQKQLSLTSGGDTLMPTSFTITDRGLRLYSPVSIGGKTVQTFAFSQADTTFTCLDKDGEGVVLHGVEHGDGDVVPFRDYEGTYLLRYNNNSGSVRVQLAPSRIDGTYRLRGLGSNYELKLTYDEATGHLTLAPQTVGDIGGQAVYFATYSMATGRLWISDDASFTLQWNKNRVYVGYNFTATNPSRYDCDSALLIVLTIHADGTASASLADGSGWGPNMLPNITSLMKVRN